MAVSSWPEQEASSYSHVEPGRVPRISRLMALAIRFDELIARGDIKNYAQLARLGHITRARVTQIMNLLHLAPDLQEQILLLPRIQAGRRPDQTRRVAAAGDGDRLEEAAPFVAKARRSVAAISAGWARWDIDIGSTVAFERTFCPKTNLASVRLGGNPNF